MADLLKHSAPLLNLEALGYYKIDYTRIAVLADTALRPSKIIGIARLRSIVDSTGGLLGLIVRSQTMRKVEYEPMLVSYIDILGFGELIKTRTAGEISRVLRVFNETTAPPTIKAHHDIPDLPQQEQVSFSDLVMTCTPLRKRGNRGVIFNQLLRLVHAQSILLIDEGILIRGGIAVGPATKSYRKYFGPAVITAYEWEQFQPGHPRIMVDPSVMSEIEQNPAVWMHDEEDELNVVKSFLAHDEEGNAFIDYLRVVLGESEKPDWVLRKHDELINARLDLFKSNKSIRRKYEWLRVYHDRTVKNVKNPKKSR